MTLVHKGNIMKFTEGAFRNWGYQLAREEFGAKPIGAGPWLSFASPVTGTDIVVKDVIADNFLQQVLLRPEEYDVIATLNLNGDYVSDALAAQVGGIGIAPGGNIGDGLAVFEATHGTAPGFAGKDRVNPGSLILSAEMMLRYLELARGGRSHHQGRDAHHRQQGTHLRPGAPARGDQDAPSASWPRAATSRRTCSA